MPYEKINTIALKRNFIDILLGLTKLQIDTGTVIGVNPETNLTLDKNYALILKDFLENKKFNDDLVLPNPNDNLVYQAKDEKIFYQIKTKDLILMGIIKPGFFAFMGIFSLIMTSIIVIGEKINETSGQTPILIIVLIVNLALYLLGILVSIIANILIYYKYQVVINDKHLVYRYGLFTNTEFRVNLNKINAVHIKQSVGYKVFKKYAVEASIIGIGEFDENDNKSNKESKYLLPIASISQINELKTLIDFETKESDYAKPKFRFLNFVLIPLIFITGLFSIPFFLLSQYITDYFVILVLYCLSYLYIVLYLILRMKRHNYYFDGRIIAINYGAFTGVLTLIHKNKIQSISYRQNPIQLLQRVGSINVKYKNILGNRVINNYYIECYDSLGKEIFDL